ncbi:related to GMP synthase [Fusarium fujikuroi]|nr:related to GMP synthase [Fusarium fujikuroi]
MPHIIRISILECWNDIDPSRSRYGGYGGLTSTWLRSNHRLQQQAEIRIWDIKISMEYPNLEDYDVAIIIGSPANPKGEDPWIVKLRAFVNKGLEKEKDKKFIGFCFGHQIIALACGLSIESNDAGYELATTPIQLSEIGKGLFKQDLIYLNQCHLWSVIDNGLGQVQNIGSTDHSQVQGLFLPGRLWCLQAHPEFDPAVMGQVLDLTRSELTDEEYRKARAHNQQKLDQQVALESLVNFILE